MFPNFLGAALFVIVAFASSPSRAEETGSRPQIPALEAPDDTDSQPAKTVCELIEDAARLYGLSVDFFTRLIWQESRFRANALSPKGAQGIAQFMPHTATRRGLVDPFDPHLAIPASAEYLRDLSAQFGNHGIAAAAYNAGEERVADWLAGERGLPLETRDYVLKITGREADEWTIFDPNTFPNGILPGPKVTGSCLEISALLSRPGAGSERLESVKQADWAPWGAQVGGNFSLERAMKSYSALQKRHPDILGGKAPMVVRSVNKSRGRAPLFLIRAPAATQEEATGLCRKLRSPCVVFHN